MTKLESIQAAEKKLLLSTYERTPVLFVEAHRLPLAESG